MEIDFWRCETEWTN